MLAATRVTTPKNDALLGTLGRLGLHGTRCAAVVLACTRSTGNLDADFETCTLAEVAVEDPFLAEDLPVLAFLADKKALEAPVQQKLRALSQTLKGEALQSIHYRAAPTRQHEVFVRAHTDLRTKLFECTAKFATKHMPSQSSGIAVRTANGVGNVYEHDTFASIVPMQWRPYKHSLCLPWCA